MLKASLIILVVHLAATTIRAEYVCNKLDRICITCVGAQCTEPVYRSEQECIRRCGAENRDEYGEMGGSGSGHRQRQRNEYFCNNMQSRCERCNQFNCGTDMLTYQSERECSRSCEYGRGHQQGSQHGGRQHGGSRTFNGYYCDKRQGQCHECPSSPCRVYASGSTHIMPSYESTTQCERSCRRDRSWSG